MRQRFLDAAGRHGAMPATTTRSSRRDMSSTSRPASATRHAGRRDTRNWTSISAVTLRGSRYVSIRYSERLAEAGIEPSVGSKGDSYDNAQAEMISGLYKTN
jgi:transposase InsO family protein